MAIAAAAEMAGSGSESELELAGVLVAGLMGICVGEKSGASGTRLNGEVGLVSAAFCCGVVAAGGVDWSVGCGASVVVSAECVTSVVVAVASGVGSLVAVGLG